ncbi:hypothetical protein RJT34_27179 [Clitoria ternatea]|uniref:Uncharacterized protein n=1 Tax=Clitoria ternatea TaxID=43366 RepID=A0AAN9I9K1_CLITE
MEIFKVYLVSVVSFLFLSLVASDRVTTYSIKTSFPSNPNLEVSTHSVDSFVDGSSSSFYNIDRVVPSGPNEQQSPDPIPPPPFMDQSSKVLNFNRNINRLVPSSPNQQESPDPVHPIDQLSAPKDFSSDSFMFSEHRGKKATSTQVLEIKSCCSSSVHYVEFALQYRLGCCLPAHSQEFKHSSYGSNTTHQGLEVLSNEKGGPEHPELDIPGLDYKQLDLKCIQNIRSSPTSSANSNASLEASMMPSHSFSSNQLLAKRKLFAESQIGRSNFEKLLVPKLPQLPGIGPFRVVLENVKDKVLLLI